jgi:hypothetical protein
MFDEHISEKPFVMSGYCMNQYQSFSTGICFHFKNTSEIGVIDELLNMSIPFFALLIFTISGKNDTILGLIDEPHVGRPLHQDNVAFKAELISGPMLGNSITTPYLDFSVSTLNKFSSLPTLINQGVVEIPEDSEDTVSLNKFENGQPVVVVVDIKSKPQFSHYFELATFRTLWEGWFKNWMERKRPKFITNVPLYDNNGVANFCAYLQTSKKVEKLPATPKGIRIGGRKGTKYRKRIKKKI